MLITQTIYGLMHFLRSVFMWRWDLSESPACDCGADQQTANHIITEWPQYRPNGLHGLIDVDAYAATR